MEETIMKSKTVIRGMRNVVFASLLVCGGLMFSPDKECKAEEKMGFVVDVKGDTVYCKFLTKKGIKKGMSSSNIFFYPQKGTVTGTVKYKMNKNVKYYFDEGRRKKKTGIRAVRKVVLKESKDHKKGLPTTIEIKNGKCTFIQRRWIV